MIMTADEVGIINEDAKEWVLLRRRAELCKLRRKLVEDEEFEAAQQEGRSGGRSDSPDNLDFPNNHRSAAATMPAPTPSTQTPTPSTWTPTAFTTARAEVAGLPRQQFQSTSEFPAN